VRPATVPLGAGPRARAAASPPASWSRATSRDQWPGKGRQDVDHGNSTVAAPESSDAGSDHRAHAHGVALLAIIARDCEPGNTAVPAPLSVASATWGAGRCPALRPDGGAMAVCRVTFAPMTGVVRNPACYAQACSTHRHFGNRSSERTSDVAGQPSRHLRAPLMRGRQLGRHLPLRPQSWPAALDPLQSVAILSSWPQSRLYLSPLAGSGFATFAAVERLRAFATSRWTHIDAHNDEIGSTERTRWPTWR
jgi:hypothetical protein